MILTAAWNTIKQTYQERRISNLHHLLGCRCYLCNHALLNSIMHNDETLRWWKTESFSCALSISHRVGWNQKCRGRSLFSIPVALHSPSKSPLMGWWREHTHCITVSIIHPVFLHLEPSTGSLGCFNEPLQFLSDNLYAMCAYMCAHVCLYTSACKLEMLWTHTHADIRLSLQSFRDNSDLLAIYFSPTFSHC